MSFNLGKGILSGVWAITDDAARAQIPLVRSFLNGQFPSFSKEQIEERKALSTVGYLGPAHTAINNPSSHDGGMVAVISYKDIVVKYPDGCGVMGTDHMASQIRAAANDPRIVGIIIDMDTPGGALNAVENPINAINEAKANKPVLLYTDNLIASAGYWIGAAATEIYCASEMNAIGSIGVCRTLIDYDAMLGAMNGNVKAETLYGSQSTDKNKGSRDWAKGDNKTAQEELDQFNERFVGHVKSVRPSVKDGALTGKVMLAEDAMSFGLIDGMRSFASTIDRVFELAEERTSNASDKNAIEMKYAVKGMDKTIEAVQAGADATMDQIAASNEEMKASNMMLIKAEDYLDIEQKATKADGALSALNSATSELDAIAGELGLTPKDGKYTDATGKEVKLSEATKAVVEEKNEYGAKAGAADAPDATTRDESENDNEYVDPTVAYAEDKLKRQGF